MEGLTSHKGDVFTFNVQVGGRRGYTRRGSSPSMSRKEGGGALQGRGLHIQRQDNREKRLYKEGVFTFNVKVQGRRGSTRRGSSPSISR